MIPLYKTIVMDPPWMERGGGKIKRGADRHYPLVKTKDLPALIRGSGMFTPDVEQGCSLWMWATANFLPDAMWLMGELGAEYVTNAVWVKEGPPGLGQRMRMMHEHLLYGRFGTVPVPSPANRLPSVIIAPRGRHSAKPEEAFALIERHDQRYDADGRPAQFQYRLEMFCRTPRPGWDAWGNEVNRDAQEDVPPL